MKLCSYTECTGCLACVQTCPQNAIIVIKDNLGFAFPKIKNDLCINCGKCRKICHVCSRIEKNNEPIDVYHFKNEDNIRINSSSGGFFTEVATYLLKQNYHIAGVVFDDDYYGAHYEVTRSIDRVMDMRKSKYVSARLGSIYQDSVKILTSGGKVFFVGLPCHVAGFLKFLNGRFNNQVITMDLMCFGNGSPLVYARSLERFAKLKSNNTIVEKVDFRHKPFINKIHTIIDIKIDNKEYTLFSNEYPYYFGYVHRLILRQSCYNCIYNSCNRITDITVGDVAGNKDPLGENVVICNTATGRNIILNIQKNNEHCIIYTDNSMKELTKKRFSYKEQPRIYDKIRACSDVNMIEQYIYNEMEHSDDNTLINKCYRKARHYLKALIKRI